MFYQLVDGLINAQHALKLYGCYFHSFFLLLLCSLQVLKEYLHFGNDFLLKAFNSPNYLEDLTGLSTLYVQAYDDQVRFFFSF